RALDQGARVPGCRRQGLRVGHRHQPVPRLQDPRARDRIRNSDRPGADCPGAMPRADDRRDHRRLHRRRRRHRRLLRPPYRDEDDENRICDRTHAGYCLSMSNISRLTALIGPARVKDLIFTARLIGAEEAASIGLLNEVVEDVSALERRVGELATLIAGNAPLTLSATKQALARLQRRLSREEGEDLILMCYMSRDFREGLDAFLNKRQPQWAGE